MASYFKILCKAVLKVGEAELQTGEAPAVHSCKPALEGLVCALCCWRCVLQGAKRTTELLQSDNFTLRKEVNSLRVAMQAVGMTPPPLPDSLAAAPRASTVMRSSVMVSRPSIMSAPQGLASLSHAAVYAKEGPAPRSSIYGRPRTTSSLTGSPQSIGTGGSLSMGGSMPLPGAGTAGSSVWGSGAGAGGISSAGSSVLAGIGSSGGTHSAPGVAKVGVSDSVSFLSLTGAPGGQALGQQALPNMHGQGPVGDGTMGLHKAVSQPGEVLLSGAACKASPSPRGAPGQQLLPTIRSSVVKPG